MRRTLALALLVGCPARSPEPAPTPDDGPPIATAWPAADSAMQRSLRWRGGDAAYSVAIPGDRVLWLYGDSFVGLGDGGENRSGRTMVRNTLAVQTGRDPSTATMRFFDGGQGEPAAFFPAEDELGIWPGPASRVGDGLLLTFTRIRAVKTGLGFETVDSKATRVAAAMGPPTTWTFEPVALPETPAGTQLGLGAHLENDGWLYAYVPIEPGRHDVFVGRWPLAALEAGNTGAMTWWSGSAWAPTADGAAAVATDVQTEFSVSAVGDELWMISTLGFGAVDIAVRTAPRPEGPWSQPRHLYRPPEYGKDGVLVYSAKAHPHLRGAPLVLTYSTNRTDFWDLAADLSVYFPRFVRVTPR